MDASKSDIDFDSYWDEEARNPNRNRIRIGRQYQAQVPPLLKSGESDGRRLEELETLSYNPHNQLNSGQLDQYFAIAKAIGLFTQAIDTCQEGVEDQPGDEALDQEDKPFDILDIGSARNLLGESDDTKRLNTANSSTNVPITTPEKQSITTRQQRLQQQKELQHSSLEGESSSSSSSGTSYSPLKQATNTQIQNFLKGLPAFISSHHPTKSEKQCKFPSSTCADQSSIDLGSNEKHSFKTLSKLLMGEWTTADERIFTKALQECGKNFSAIKKDYLPWKSVCSIIEFYYLNLDKDHEQQQQKKKSAKSQNKTNFDKPNESPKLDDSKKNKSSKDNLDSEKSNEKGDCAEEAGDNDNSTNNSNNVDNANNLSSDSKNDTGKSCPNEDDSKPSLNSASLVKLSSTSLKNGVNMNDLIRPKPASNGNVNGNNNLFSEFKRNSLAGQEVKTTRSKQNDGAENGTTNGGNSSLGSLNLYLHGELVLKLNAQQQETGQKWVESMEMPTKKKRSITVNSNGLSNNSSRALKRPLDIKYGNFFKEEPDDVSVCGGDVSGSDDDSLTSNESSSLVASSPSSSSTINSAAKKARVKVENLNMNGNLMSSPNSSNRKTDSINNGTHKQRTISPSVIENEVELKKKILEANLSLFRPDNGHLQLLLNNPLVGSLFEPPKAHSSVAVPSNTALYSPQHLLNVSPVKTPPTRSEPLPLPMNGHSNGVHSTGPVDLTRKSSNGLPPNELLSIEAAASLHSPSRLKVSSPSLPKVAHESTNSSNSPHRLTPNSFGLFSLPAPPPPPPNVPVSPNGGSSKHLKKSLVHTGGAQYAK